MKRRTILGLLATSGIASIAHASANPAEFKRHRKASSTVKVEAMIGGVWVSIPYTESESTIRFTIDHAGQCVRISGVKAAKERTRWPR